MFVTTISSKAYLADCHLLIIDLCVDTSVLKNLRLATIANNIGRLTIFSEYQDPSPFDGSYIAEKEKAMCIAECNKADFLVVAVDNEAAVKTACEYCQLYHQQDSTKHIALCLAPQNGINTSSLKGAFDTVVYVQNSAELTAPLIALFFSYYDAGGLSGFDFLDLLSAVTSQKEFFLRQYSCTDVAHLQHLPRQMCNENSHPILIVAFLPNTDSVLADVTCIRSKILEAAADTPIIHSCFDHDSNSTKLSLLVFSTT